MSSERFRPAETPSEQTPGLERVSRDQDEAARRRRRRGGGGTGQRDQHRGQGSRDARDAPVTHQEPGGHGPHDARTAHEGHSGHGHGHEVELRPGWSRPKPEHVPHPTYWPAVLALGVTFLAWGLITSYVISAVGLVLFGLALGGWIWEMRHDR